MFVLAVTIVMTFKIIKILIKMAIIILNKIKNKICKRTSNIQESQFNKMQNLVYLGVKVVVLGS